MKLYVNDELIDERMIDEETDRLKPQYDAMFQDQPEEERTKQLREWSKENVIERMLLQQAANAFGKSIPREQFERFYQDLVQTRGGNEAVSQKLKEQEMTMEEFRQGVERHYALDQHIDWVTHDVPPLNDRELRERYEANASRFLTPEVVRAGHIVLHVNAERTREQALADIQEISSQLNAGRPFEELAGQYSDCPENEGDLGFFPRGEMVEEFENVVFALAVGATSCVIESPFGLHIAKLYEKRNGEPIPLERVKEILQEEHVRERKDRMLEDYLDSLRSTAAIVEKE
jgi:parvulin-like peptidyl-prolyl isomerase